ncbi:MAG: VWA domain-containing protein [Planctomycetaceae bacterium]|nr:VWA domain-containing protein [Planctomycetaceae bacterium]
MLSLRARWDHPARPVDGVIDRFLLVDVGTEQSVRPASTSVCILLDISHSMEGERLGRAREACVAAWSRLQPEDAFTLVAFSAKASLVIAPQRAKRLTAERLTKTLAALEAASATRLDLAIQKADDCLDHPICRNCSASTVILVTDGHPTGADGQWLGVTARQALLDSVQHWQARGVRLITVGLGSAKHFDRPFLSELARHGGGRFKHVLKPDDLGEALSCQVELAQHALAGRMTLAIKALVPGAALKEAWSVFDQRALPIAAEDGGSWVVDCGAAAAPQRGGRPACLLRVETPARVPYGESSILSVTATVAGGEGMVTTSAANVSLRYSADPAELDAGDEHVVALRENWGLARRQSLIDAAESPAQAERELLAGIEQAKRAGVADQAARFERQRHELAKDGAVSPETSAEASRTLSQVSRMLLMDSQATPAPPPAAPSAVVSSASADQSGPDRSTHSRGVNVALLAGDAPEATPPRAGWTLQVVRGLSIHRRFALSRPRMTIGYSGFSTSGARPDINLTEIDPDAAPAKHETCCELIVESSSLSVRKVTNQSACFVDDAPVPEGQAQLLRNGSRLQIRSVIFLVVKS